MRTCSNDMRSDILGQTYTLVLTVKKYFTGLQSWRDTEKLTSRNLKHLMNVLSAARHLVNSTNLCVMNIFILERGLSPAPSVAKASLSQVNAETMRGRMRQNQKNVTNVMSVTGLLHKPKICAVIFVPTQERSLMNASSVKNVLLGQINLKHT